MGPPNGTILIRIITSGPKNGSIFRPQKWGRENAKFVAPARVWDRKLGEAPVPALMLLNFWNSKMVALQNAMVDQTRGLFARITKKWVSSVQEKVSIVPILYPYNHSNIGRLTCDCAARKRLVKYICTARGLSPSLVLVIAAHTHFWLLET